MLKSFLSEHELEHIKNHQYKTSGYSSLDKKMNPFWELVSDYLPYAVTPNMVTLLGLFFLFSPIPLILYFDLQCNKFIPIWLYFYMALAVFLGQTFDAVDGKHARKTKRSSPLGQLMDHGCDAFSNSFIVVMIAQAFRFGPGIYTILIQILVQSTFFLMNWEEYMTGVLCTNVNDFGTTEIQFISMGLLIFPAFDYFDVAHYNIIKGMRLLDILVLISFVISVYMSILTIWKVVKQTTEEKFLKGLGLLISPAILFICQGLFYRIQIYEEYTSLIIILNGMLFGFITNKMIVTTMSKGEPELISLDTIIYLLIVVVCHYCPFWQQFVLLVFFLLFVTFRYIHYLLSIIFQLLNYLNINF